MRPTEHPPGYKAGTYTVSYKCSNCKHTVAVSINQGNRAPKTATIPYATKGVVK